MKGNQIRLGPNFFGYTNLFHHYLPYSKANIDGQDPEIAEAVCVNLKQGVATLQDDMRPLTQEVIWPNEAERVTLSSV